MKKKIFVMALMLASSLAWAQSSGSSPGSTDHQQPAPQQNQPTTSNQAPASSGQSSMTGCLKGSDGSWVLVAEGQSTPVTGDSATLSPHNGHQVQLKGMPGSDGSFQVTDVVMIAESCPSPQGDASSGAVAAQNAGDSVVSGAKMVALDTTQAAQSATQSTDNSAAQSNTQSATPQSTAPQSTTRNPQPQPRLRRAIRLPNRINRNYRKRLLRYPCWDCWVSARWSQAWWRAERSNEQGRV